MSFGTCLWHVLVTKFCFVFGAQTVKSIETAEKPLDSGRRWQSRLQSASVTGGKLHLRRIIRVCEILSQQHHTQCTNTLGPCLHVAVQILHLGCKLHVKCMCITLYLIIHTNYRKSLQVKLVDALDQTPRADGCHGWIRDFGAANVEGCRLYLNARG